MRLLWDGFSGDRSQMQIYNKQWRVTWRVITAAVVGRKKIVASHRRYVLQIVKANSTRVRAVIETCPNKVSLANSNWVRLRLLQGREHITFWGWLVGPPYWQIKQINPFFMLNPFPYHKIMKIQIPPFSQIWNCSQNITPGVKRKKNSPPVYPVVCMQDKYLF